ncbi:hypothetical protein E0E54_12340 [Azotobacter chroococcum]|uniref:hypothetical protein n=1 Tax=Azotobacter chroococcum TaxID=353 RepID=UPI001039E0B4|nr:hypothetical protein [Azotobacter chroococcum]TBW35285.1 hypothetical protein E0E54_12340 [Azotobacter chroococcum]
MDDGLADGYSVRQDSSGQCLCLKIIKFDLYIPFYPRDTLPEHRDRCRITASGPRKLREIQQFCGHEAAKSREIPG